MTDDAKQAFPRDVATHRMTVQLDQGVFRHIRFARPGSNSYAFEITTWPGHLAFSGNMGCFVFSRLHDMFGFFRHDDINPGYWAEKVVAEDSHSPGVKEWSPDRFRACVLEHVHDRTAEDGVSQGLLDAVMEEVLAHADCEQEACQAAHSFTFRMPDGRTFQFDDFFENRLTEHTYHFLWCLYAIVHAIKAYDKSKAEAVAT